MRIKIKILVPPPDQPTDQLTNYLTENYLYVQPTDRPTDRPIILPKKHLMDRFADRPSKE